jgi:hypothetical protein
VTWTPEQAAQRTQWDLERLDADPQAGATVDPIEAYRARRDASAAVQEPPPEVALLSPSIDIAEVSTDPPPPMLIERLDPEGHTILFGTGGVGKGALACYWIAQLVSAGHGVLIVDYESHPAEWSRRIASLAPEAHASGRIRHMTPRDPLRACAETVALEATSHELTVVVVDSAVMACGSDPLKPEVAGDYAAAVMRVGLPVLSLAHVTKADDMRYPFGSIFWHNLARTTWGMQADQSGTVVLGHKKHNNYATLGRFAVVSTWLDGRLMEVYERDHKLALRDRIREVLTVAPMTLADVVEALNDDETGGVPVKRDSVKRTLNKYIPDFFRLSGSVYEVAS